MPINIYSILSEITLSQLPNGFDIFLYLAKVPSSAANSAIDKINGTDIHAFSTGRNDNKQQPIPTIAIPVMATKLGVTNVCCSFFAIKWARNLKGMFI